MSMIENFEKMLAAGQDSALLRYSLGTAYQKAGEPERALDHLASAVKQDPGYSAAWKVYGKLLAEVERLDEAISAFEKVSASQRRREMSRQPRRCEYF